jgi:hypothetical protein
MLCLIHVREISQRARRSYQSKLISANKQVVVWLREDILGVIADHNSESFVDMSDFTDSASKLKAYTHLFDAQAMKAFNQLTQNEAQDVDASTAEWDENADDNEQGTL